MEKSIQNRWKNPSKIEEKSIQNQWENLPKIDQKSTKNRPKIGKIWSWIILAANVEK